ncbi:MAG: gamma-glutamylcyclotransferase family protein [Myxococcota bacterium]
MKIFVYGTLRRGAPMHGLLEGRVRFLGAGSVAGRLLDLGAFPGLVPPEAEGDRVEGELFAIVEGEAESLLDAADRYEGETFRRSWEAVEGPAGPEEAWLYWYIGERTGPELDPGDLPTNAKGPGSPRG